MVRTYSGMVHLNGNLLASIDLETTGLQAGTMSHSDCDRTDELGHQATGGRATVLHNHPARSTRNARKERVTSMASRSKT